MNTIVSKLFSGLLALFALLLVSFATAEITLTNPDQLTLSINYGELRDNDNDLSFSQSIDLKNSGTVAETVTLSLTDISSEYTDFQLDGSTSVQTFTLAPDGTKTIRLTGTVPVNQESGTHSNIAKLKINTVSGQDTSLSINTKVKQMLDLDRIYVYLNGNYEESISSDDDTLSDLNPGDKVELKFALDNLFDDNYDDGRITGTVNFQLDDSDFGDEIDEEASFDIKAGESVNDEDDVSVVFTVPSTAEEGDYTGEIKITSKDRNKAHYDFTWKLNLEIIREKNDLKVDTLTLSSEEVSCDRQVTATVKVINSGSNDQDRGVLALTNTELGLNQKYEFKIDEGTSKDNYVTKEFTFSVDPKIMSGSFPITAIVFYNTDKLSDQKYINLLVKNCVTAKSTTSVSTANNASASVTPASNSGSSTSATPAKTSSDNNLISSAAIVKTVEKSYTTDDYIVAAMIAGIILIILLIALFIVILLK